jgi:hypothetical protein
MALSWPLADSALAVEWIGNPGIVASLSTIYTDNVCQSSENQRGQWLGGVGLSTAPSGSIRGKGSRSEFNLGGSVQVNTLNDSQLNDDECFGESNGDNEQFAPNLYGTGSATLVDNLLKVSVNGRAAQNEVSPYLGAGGDPYGGNGNTNTFYRYSISPELNRRLKNTSTANLKYTYDEIINSSDAVSNSTSDALAATLTNHKSSQISWKWLANYRKIQYSDPDYVLVNNGNNRTVVPRQDTELKSAGLNMGYRIDRRWQVTGTYGWEWNDYQTFNNADTGGNAWSVGVNWTPSARTSVRIGMGDRFFGKTPNLDISHTRKRSVFTASYKKDITFARDIRTEDNLVNPGFGFNSALNTQSAIIEERFNLGYSYNGRRAVLSASGNYSNQLQEDNGETSVYRSVAVSVSPMISSIYTLSGTIAWNEDEPEGFFGVSNIGPSIPAESWTTTVQVGRQLSERMNMSLGYQYTDQRSDDSFNEFQENRVVATVDYSL